MPCLLVQGVSVLPSWACRGYLHCHPEHAGEYETHSWSPNLITSLLVYAIDTFKTSCDSIGCARSCSSPLCAPSLKAAVQREYNCFFDCENLPLARQLKVFQTRGLSTPALTEHVFQQEIKTEVYSSSHQFVQFVYFHFVRLHAVTGNGQRWRRLLGEKKTSGSWNSKVMKGCWQNEHGGELTAVNSWNICKGRTVQTLYCYIHVLVHSNRCSPCR